MPAWTTDTPTTTCVEYRGDPSRMYVRNGADVYADPPPRGLDKPRRCPITQRDVPHRSLVVPEQRAEVRPRLRVVIQIPCHQLAALAMEARSVRPPVTAYQSCWAHSGAAPGRRLTHTVPHARLDPFPTMPEHIHHACPARGGDDGEWDLRGRNRLRVGRGGSERREGVRKRLGRVPRRSGRCGV